MRQPSKYSDDLLKLVSIVTVCLLFSCGSQKKKEGEKLDPFEDVLHKVGVLEIEKGTFRLSLDDLQGTFIYGFPGRYDQKSGEKEAFLLHVEEDQASLFHENQTDYACKEPRSVEIRNDRQLYLPASKDCSEFLLNFIGKSKDSLFILLSNHSSSSISRGDQSNIRQWLTHYNAPENIIPPYFSKFYSGQIDIDKMISASKSAIRGYFDRPTLHIAGKPKFYKIGKTFFGQASSPIIVARFWQGEWKSGDDDAETDDVCAIITFDDRVPELEKNFQWQLIRYNMDRIKGDHLTFEIKQDLVGATREREYKNTDDANQFKELIEGNGSDTILPAKEFAFAYSSFFMRDLMVETDSFLLSCRIKQTGNTHISKEKLDSMFSDLIERRSL